MEFYDVINTRRSVRQFSDKDIPEDIIKKIMVTAGRAPSGSNRQNWKYILISDKSIQKKISGICKGQKFIAQCPVTVVICGKDMSASYNRGNYMGELGMLVDTSISFTHFILAARAEGLGTCWVGLFDNEEMKKLLNVPDGWDVAAISPLGYPKKENAFHSDISRISYEELVSENEFQEPYNKRDYKKL